MMQLCLFVAEEKFRYIYVAANDGKRGNLLIVKRRQYYTDVQLCAAQDIQFVFMTSL